MKSPAKSIGVFCGSHLGSDPQFAKSASELGFELARRGITLVYGGANVGLMGVVADAVLDNGGRAIGVMPKFLQDREIAHKGLTEIHFCETMHERKLKMFELSQGFIAMPGGFGTLDEIFEILSWRQLRFHAYPSGFLNTNGYFDHLIALMNHMEQSKLLKTEQRETALFSGDARSLFDQMIATD